MDMEEFRRELLALIERKIAPLEKEIREQSELIAKLAETTAALMRARQGGRAEESKAQKVGGVDSETKRIKAEEAKSKAEEAKSKAEDAKRKAEEEKARKLEAKRKQDEANKKKQEEEKAAKEKARKEAEERKRGTEEKKKKEATGRGKKPAEESKKPPEELKRAVKRTVKKPEEAEPPPVTQDISQEAAPPSDNKDAALTGESPQISEESEAVKEELAAVPPSDIHLRVPEPSLSVNLDTENLLLSENSPVTAEGREEDAQPSAPDAEDHSAEIAQINEEMQKLIATHGEGPLQKAPPFQLSLGAKSAMSLLNTLDDSQLYLSSLPGREETMWVFRLFFQLGGKTLPEEKTEAWEICRTFLAAGKEAGMDKSVQEAVLSFNFSNGNIDLVEKLLGGKIDKVNPNLYNQFCTLTGLIMFTVKEGVIFAGLIPDKAAPWRKYQRLVYRRSLFS